MSLIIYFITLDYNVHKTVAGKESCQLWADTESEDSNGMSRDFFQQNQGLVGLQTSAPSIVSTDNIWATCD